MPSLVRDRQKMELKQEFCQWIRPDSSRSESMAAAKDGFTWRLCCPDFPPTFILRFFALRLFAIAAGAADLERVWSATRLCMSPKRSRLEKDRVLKGVQIETSNNKQRQKEQGSFDLERSRIES